MSEVQPEPEWQRLDPRMLLVHPLKELVRFIPVLLGVLVAGAAIGGMWELLAVAFPVGLGVLRYFTTTFRITADRVELRRGLVDRHRLAVPLDRVRTVDLTASLVHRLLGLTTLRIGTGTASTDADERVDLDGLPDGQARELRARLLRQAPAAAYTAGEDAAPGPPPPPVAPVARFEPRWLRYAPFTSGGLALVGAALGLLSQGGGFTLDLRIGPGRSPLPFVPAWPVALALVALVVLVLLVVTALSVVTYAAAYWRLELTHPAPGAPWHLRRGLLTTRETSIDEERLAGVTLREPLPLRLTRGARLTAIVTGQRGERAAGSVLVPPAPLEVSQHAATAVVGDREPVTGPLVGHGPAARRRRLARALVPAAVLAGGLVGLAVAVGPWWLGLGAPLLLLGAVPLGVDRARALGHALVDLPGGSLLVARSGSIARRRDVVASRHVIGWTFRSTWFQRRAGLTTLLATTAGGDQRVMVLDVPDTEAVALARASVPGLVDQFLGVPGKVPDQSPAGTSQP